MAWLREQLVPIIELDCSGTPAEVWEQLPTLFLPLLLPLSLTLTLTQGVAAAAGSG